MLAAAGEDLLTLGVLSEDSPRRRQKGKAWKDTAHRRKIQHDIDSLRTNKHANGEQMSEAFVTQQSHGADDRLKAEVASHRRKKRQAGSPRLTDGRAPCAVC